MLAIWPDTQTAPRERRLSLQQQRFCPLCDRGFVDGEAVLRCSGCRVLHHPSCWVKNDGCITEQAHTRTPVAEAYGALDPGAAPGSHFGEGTRLGAAPQTVIGPLGTSAPRRPPPRPQQLPVIGRIDDLRQDPEASGDYVIGETTPPKRRREPAPYMVNAGEMAKRRYRPEPEPSAFGRPLPRLYGNHRWLGYWYVPAAAVVAIAIAAVVILAVEALFGDDAGGDEAVVTQTGPPGTATAEPGTDGTPGAGVTATADAATPTNAGRFQPGQGVAVAGLSADECLNIREAAGRTNTATLQCVPNGTELTVLGGPRTADDIQWWNVQSPGGEGWAAEEFLAARP